MTLEEIEMGIYKISAQYRCARKGPGDQDCDHKKCEAVYDFWKDIETYLKNMAKCQACDGSGKRKVSL